MDKSRQQEISTSPIASSLAGTILENNLANGKTISIPSLGIEINPAEVVKKIKK